MTSPHGCVDTEKKTNGFSPQTYERICLSMVRERRCTGASGTNANDAHDVAHGCVDKVGATGFEPVTPWPPAKCATRLRHAPLTRHCVPLSSFAP